MNAVLILGVAFATLATIACIVSTAIPYWLYDNSDRHNGLWRACTNVFGPVICGNLSKFGDVAGWMKAVRAMMIMSILTLAPSACFSFLFAFVMRKRNMLDLISGVLALVGGALAITGVIIYAVKMSEQPKTGLSLHAGFGLAIVAAVFGVLAGILIILGRRKAFTMN